MPARCCVDRCQSPWNKGLLVGQKKALEPKHVWSIRVRLEIAKSRRDLAIFNLAIDSKLRACDLVKLRLDDICLGAMCDVEQQSRKRRQGGLSSLRSQNNPKIQSKPGYHCSGPPALDTSSQADFVSALTYQPANMHGWCIDGSRASA
jgi:hypothetical protein